MSNVVPLIRPKPAPPKPPQPKADMWPQVRDRFIKLGRYGFCGMRSEKPGDKLPKDVKDFITAMQFIPVATPAALERLWEVRPVCMILINIKNKSPIIDTRSFNKYIDETLSPLGIKAVFDSMANNHFGIYRILHLNSPDREIGQRMEENDFVNAQAVFLESPLRFRMLGLNQEFDARQSFLLHAKARGIDGKIKIIRGNRFIENIDSQGRTNLAIGRQLL